MCQTQLKFTSHLQFRFVGAVPDYDLHRGCTRIEGRRQPGILLQGRPNCLCRLGALRFCPEHHYCMEQLFFGYFDDFQSIIDLSNQ